MEILVELRQVLTNLLGNAIKFTDEGEVRIETKIREESDDDALIYFGVVDSGVGISQKIKTNSSIIRSSRWQLHTAAWWDRAWPRNQ